MDSNHIRGSFRNRNSVSPYRARQIANSTLVVRMANAAEWERHFTTHDPNRGDGGVAFVNGRIVN